MTKSHFNVNLQVYREINFFEAHLTDSSPDLVSSILIDWCVWNVCLSLLTRRSSDFTFFSETLPSQVISIFLLSDSYFWYILWLWLVTLAWLIKTLLLGFYLFFCCTFGMLNNFQPSIWVEFLGKFIEVLKIFPKDCNRIFPLKIFIRFNHVVVFRLSIIRSSSGKSKPKILCKFIAWFNTLN